jgi:hypothetical protein
VTRFHVTGDFGTVYLALDPETALRELARRRPFRTSDTTAVFTRTGAPSSA